MTPTEMTLDVRELVPGRRHELIIARLAALPYGGVLRLVNDHDPRPLWYQLQAEAPGQFTWQYLEADQGRWAVRIERIAEAAAAPPQQPFAEASTTAPKAGPYLDNRGLEPPEPMVRILEALNELEQGSELTSRLDREPLLLYPHLTQRGFAYNTTAEPGGTYLVRIWHEA